MLSPKTITYFQIPANLEFLKQDHSQFTVNLEGKSIHLEVDLGTQVNLVQSILGQELFLTSQQTQELLDCSYPKLMSRVNGGELPAFGPTTRNLYKLSHVLRLRAGLKAKSEAEILEDLAGAEVE